MRAAQRDRTALTTEAGGAAYVEFLMAFVPVWILFLGLVQMGELWAANAVVQHAANRGVRAAVVILDDDPRLYEGTPRLELGDARLTAAQLAEGAGRVGYAGRGPRGPLRQSRRAAIEMAAALPLLVLSAAGTESLAEAIAHPPIEERAAHTIEALDVDFVSPGGGQARTADREGEVTVRLTYRYECSVPIVAALVCRSGGTTTLTASATLTNQGADYPYLSEVN